MTLVLVCLLVNYDGKPMRVPYVYRESEEAYVSDLAELIRGHRTDTLAEISSTYLTLWKLHPPLLAFPPAEVSTGMKALVFEARMGHEKPVSRLEGLGVNCARDFHMTLLQIPKQANTIFSVDGTCRGSQSCHVYAPKLSCIYIDTQLFARVMRYLFF